MTEKLKEAIQMLGGLSSTARILGVTPSAVCQWKQTPVRHVLALEKATGRKFTRHELRPDIYPDQ